MDSNSDQRTRPRRIAFAVALATLAAGAYLAARPAAAQFADPDFWSTDGGIAALALDGNTLYAGGNFGYAGPSNGSCVAVGRTTGTPLAGWPRFDGQVYAVVGDGEGGWIVGGRFGVVNGVGRRNLVRVRPGGALAPEFPEADQPVRALAVTLGSVYAGGDFSLVGDQARSHIAEIRLADGAVTSWNPAADGSVEALAASGGRVYVGGSFTQVAGQARAHLAAFDRASGALEAWNPSTNGPVRSLLLGPGRVFVGGYFWLVAGQTRVVAACIDSASGQVTAWNAGLTAVNATVYALAGDGTRVFIGGSFDLSNGQPRDGLAAVDAVTGATLDWNPNVLFSGWHPTIKSLAVSGGALYVGGAFDHVGTASRLDLAAIDASSGALLDWQGGSAGEIVAIAVSGDTIVAGGTTQSCGGIARTNLAAFDATSGEPTDWRPTTDRVVQCLVPCGNTIYVGGQFNLVEDNPRHGAAALGAATGELLPWDPQVWGTVYSMLPHNGRVHIGGYFATVGSTPRSNLAEVDSATAQPTGWNPGADYMVNTLARVSDTLYAGGSFSHVGGLERHGLVALDATSGAVSDWNPDASGMVLALAPDGPNLYAGGLISYLGGSGTSGFVRLSRATGQVGFAPQLLSNALVLALALDGDAVHLGGDFQLAPWIGQRQGLAAFDTHTDGLLPGPYQDLRVVQTLQARDGSVYLGGDFAYEDTVSHRNLVRILPRDTIAPTVSVGPVADADFGESLAITWTATDDFRVQSVDGELSRTGPDGPWEAIFLGAPNSGSLGWAASGTASRTCWLRVSARDYQGNVATSDPTGPFRIGPTTTAAGDASPPASLALAPPSPSPARGAFRIAFELPRRADVRLSLLDVQGRELALAAQGSHGAGRHEARFDAHALAPGLYFVRLRAGAENRVRRVVVTSR